MSEQCQCVADGFCERYKRTMSGRPREICQGINISPEKADAYRANWLQIAAADARDAPCVHLGASTGETVVCGSCTNQTKLKVFTCAVHGSCTIAKPAGVACCRSCPNYAPSGSYGGQLLRRFDEKNLSPGQSGKRFNASLIADPTTPGGYLLAFRDGWRGSEVYLIRLDVQFQPVGQSWHLPLRHPLEANYGREDPRLFMHNGRLHIAYIGVVGGHSILHTSVLYARLSEDCASVEQIWYPHLPQRNAWEKNWSMFSHAGELFAIYSIAPHRVAKIDGHRADFVYETPALLQWQGGEMRGGASPVLVGDEWWHFFHDRVETEGLKTYRTGVYTFENKPPFRIARYLPEPILCARPESKPPEQYAAVVFTCGAVKAGDRWVLSSGIHDRWSELHAFSHSDLEAKLQPCLLSERIARAIEKSNGWCTVEKAQALADAVLSLKPELVVEIGVFAGKSLLPIAIALSSIGRGKVIGIDPWSAGESIKELSGENQAWWQSVDHRAMHRECVEAIAREYVSDFVELVQARSDAYTLRAGQMIDLLHIDGSHGEEASCYDVTHYASRVRVGGMLFMDDIGWAGKAYAMLPGLGFKEIRQLDTGAIFVREQA